MTASLEDRIIELEIRLAHYEQTADDLTDVVVRQGREIEALSFELRRLRDRMQTALDNRADGSPQDERPPPHY